MTKIKKLKLNQLNKEEMKKQEMKSLKGGDHCAYMCTFNCDVFKDPSLSAFNIEAQNSWQISY